MYAIRSYYDLLGGIIADILFADNEAVIAFLKNYFQISYIEKELPDSEMSNVILRLSPYLDTLEQQNKFVREEPEPNYLYKFFEQVNNRKNADRKSFLDKHYEITDSNHKIRIESLIEIATRELKNIEINYTELVNKHLWDKDNWKDKDNEKKENPIV